MVETQNIEICYLALLKLQLSLETTLRQFFSSI